MVESSCIDNEGGEKDISFWGAKLFHLNVCLCGKGGRHAPEFHRSVVWHEERTRGSERRSQQRAKEVAAAVRLGLLTTMEMKEKLLLLVLENNGSYDKEGYREYFEAKTHVN